MIGFGVSFVGSLPLGYLNLLGFQFLLHEGWLATIQYLMGVLGIELIVIYVTLMFVNVLTQNQRLMKRIAFFAMLFMLVMALLFFFSTLEKRTVPLIIYGSPLLTGLVCSALNVAQIPFWTGWNLNLLASERIQLQGKFTFSYIAGCGIGTFLGMISLIFLLSHAVATLDSLQYYLSKIVMPLLFCGLAIFQGIRLYRMRSV